MDEELDYRLLLEKHRVEAIQCLDLDRQFLFTFLRSQSVLDDEDCEIILNAGPSRQQKCSKFLDVLATRGPRAFQFFLQALEYEHEHLYEVLTGKKPLKQRFSSKSMSPVTPVLSNKALLDHDRDYLLKEVTKLEEQSRSRAYMISKAMAEKFVLETQVVELKQELLSKEKIIHDLKEQIAQKKKPLTVDLSQTYVNHFQDLLRENAEKSNEIIMLQARLITIMEKNEQASSHNDELLKKNEDLMSQIRDLAIKYDFKRLESKRLSLQVDQNSDGLKAAADCKREVYSLKFKLNQIVEDKEAAEKKVEELTMKMSELKLQQEIAQKERFSEAEMKDQVSMNYYRFNEEIRNLQQTNEEQSNKINSLERKINRLNQEIETHKEEKAYFLSERQQAISDRDRMQEERDELRKHNKELHDLKEEIVQRQIKISTQYEKNNRDLNGELEKLRDELEAKLNEISSLKSEFRRSEDKSEDLPKNLLQQKFECSNCENSELPASVKFLNHLKFCQQPSIENEYAQPSKVLKSAAETSLKTISLFHSYLTFLNSNGNDEDKESSSSPKKKLVRS